MTPVTESDDGRSMEERVRALRFEQWQQGAEIRDVPEPGSPVGDQVLIRIGGAGACHSDLHVMHEYRADRVPWTLPITLGHENAGWVEALGSDVDGLEVGAPVAVYGAWGCGYCSRCRIGAENYCDRQYELTHIGGGLGLDGGMATYMLVPSSRLLVPLGDLNPVQAAALTDAGLTPYHAIGRSRDLLVPGSTAVVWGVGGLGHMAVQILRATTGAAIVAVDPRPSARDRAVELGADHAFDPSDAGREIRSLTRGRGADVVIDFVGTDDTLAACLAATRTRGHLTIVGIAAGTLKINFFRMPYGASVASSYWGTIPELHQVIALAARGDLAADLTEYGLDDAAQVYRDMAAGTLEGRAVIVPDAP